MDRLGPPADELRRLSGPPPACVFCAAVGGSDDRSSLVLYRGALAFLILNAFPYASGHLMAATTRHGGSLEDSSSAELTETMELVQRGIRALRATYRPDGFNVGVNHGRVAGAGVPDHSTSTSSRAGTGTRASCR